MCMYTVFMVMIRIRDNIMRTQNNELRRLKTSADNTQVNMTCLFSHIIAGTLYDFNCFLYMVLLYNWRMVYIVLFYTRLCMNGYY